MIRLVDKRLNQITMYRLVLYYLILLLGLAVIFSVVHILPYDPFALLGSISFLIAVCWITNTVFARAFGVAPGTESVYISALILALIITPLPTPNDLWFLGWAGVLAMASKYILAIHHKHVFNPVALAVALTYLTINQEASWWVGTPVMLPFVLIGGLLIVRKIGRFDLVLSFTVTTMATTLALGLINPSNLIAELSQSILYSPLLFFAFVILTEPLTTPPTRALRIIYGALVGILFSPQVHLGAVYITPELAILIGNVFSYIVSPKTTLVLRLKERAQIAPGIFDLAFVPSRKLAFAPGQYMEWRLGHPETDNRGNRRYFTLASSPTEDAIRVGVRAFENSSSFKRALLTLKPEHEIVAAQLAGDFVLPRNPRQECVFIAGGIGITPYRSMIKYLLDSHQARPITLFYANRTLSEIVYQDVFDQAEQELGIRTIYTLTDTRDVPRWWRGKTGRLDAELIQREVPNYRHCLFYISGPQGMVDSFKQVLRELDIPDAHIKTDFFAGLA